MSRKPRKEGDLCFVEIGNRKDVRLAVIKYVGRIEGKGGTFYGCEVIKGLGPFHGIGKNDGSVDGLEYFECEDGQGIFTKKIRGAKNAKESGVITRAERIQKKVYRALEHKNAIATTRGKNAAQRAGRRQKAIHQKDAKRKKLEVIRKQKTVQKSTQKQIRESKTAAPVRKTQSYMGSRPQPRTVHRNNMSTREQHDTDEHEVEDTVTKALMSTTRKGSIKRKGGPKPGRKAKAAKTSFKVGDKVKCMNKNGQWERATIVKARPTNTYDIEWDKNKAVEKFKTPRVLRKVQGTDMEHHQLEYKDNKDLRKWLRSVENGLLSPYARKFNDGTDGNDLLQFSKADLKKRIPETAPRLWLLRCIVHERKGSGFTEPELSDAPGGSEHSEEEKTSSAFEADDEEAFGDSGRGYRTLPGFKNRRQSREEPIEDDENAYDSEICMIDPTPKDKARMLKALRGNHNVTVLDSSSSPSFEIPGYTHADDDDNLTWRCNCPVLGTKRNRGGKWAVTFTVGDHPIVRGKENTLEFDEVWDSRSKSPKKGAAKPPGRKGAAAPPRRPPRADPIRNSQGTETSLGTSRPPSFGQAFGDSRMVPDSDDDFSDSPGPAPPARPRQAVKSPATRTMPTQEGTVSKVVISGMSDVDNLLLSRQARKALMMSMRIAPGVNPINARGRDDKIVVEFERKITAEQIAELQSHLRTGFEEDVVVREFRDRRAPDGSDVIFEVSGREFMCNKNEIRDKGGKLTELMERGGDQERIKLNDRSASRFALILDFYKRGFIRPGPDVSLPSLVKELEWYGIPLSSIDKSSVLQQIPRLISIFEVDDRQLDEILEKVVRDRRHTRDADHFKQQLEKNSHDTSWEVQEFLATDGLQLFDNPDFATVIRADGLEGELYKEFDISLRLRNMRTGGIKTVSFHMIAGEGYTMRILDKQIKRKDFSEALRALLGIPDKHKDSVIEGFLELVSETMEYFCDDDEF